MGMEENVGGKCFPAAWGIAARPCDSCKSSAALLYCRPDSAFLCMGCDAKVHHRLGRHERVWVCQVCEQAPAIVTCKADAAAPCVTCDRDIHSANPLAGRHERLPVSPFFDTAEYVLLKSSSTTAAAAAAAALLGGGDAVTNNSNSKFSGPNSTPNSWILPNPNPNTNAKFCSETLDVKSVELMLSDNDQFMDFDYPLSLHNSGSDSVVPVQQIRSIPPPPTATQVINPRTDSYFELDFTNANSSFTAQSVDPSVSSSSLDGRVVPDGSSMSEISYTFGKGIGSAVEWGGSGNTVPAQGTDREARVLRYREKRKNRRFQKTIRYASRKAYAETRPRIKGRFAKRTKVEPDDVDLIFSSGSPAAFLADAGGYGVVPSF